MLIVLSLNLLLAVLRSRSGGPPESATAPGEPILPSGSTLLGRLARASGIRAGASAQRASRPLL